MSKIMAVLKIFVNIFFFSIYSLFGIVVGNFFFGLILTISGNIVPASHDPVHIYVAIFSLLIVFLSTFLLRKYLYLEVFSDKFLSEEYKKKHIKNEVFDEEDLQIYVNKEL